MENIYRDSFIEELQKLKTEVNSYVDENDIWLKLDGTSNSAGHLTIHLIGNIKHFIGLGIGKIEFQRNRDNEFSGGRLDKLTLTSQIDECIEVVSRAFNNFEYDILFMDYNLEFKGGKDLSVLFMLNMLGKHFSYHLGQVNYHRRHFNA